MQIDLRSVGTPTVDTYLYLLAEDGTEITHDDDVSTSDKNSRITWTLNAGRYFVVASTFYNDKSGMFSMEVDKGTLKPVTQGEWSASGGQAVDTWRNPQFLLRLPKRTVVEILLESSVDTYLNLMGDLGQYLTHNDDISTTNRNSRISQDLYAGDYIISAGTYSNLQTGEFDLSVSDGHLRPLTFGEWTSSGGQQWDHSGNQLYWLTLDSPGQVVLDLMSDEDAYLYLVGPNGYVIKQDDDGGTATNSRVTWSLMPGTYWISAATNAPNQSGWFALTSSRGVIHWPYTNP